MRITEFSVLTERIARFIKTCYYLYTLISLVRHRASYLYRASTRHRCVSPRFHTLRKMRSRNISFVLPFVTNSRAKNNLTPRLTYRYSSMKISSRYTRLNTNVYNRLTDALTLPPRYFGAVL